jgi:hypothetical protein
MSRTAVDGFVLSCTLALAAMASSCRNSPEGRPYRDPPPPGVQTFTLDYVDSSAFDGLFESALVNREPVIVIHTGRTRPDWDGRLNAWIAAWNMGGTVRGRAPRAQGPLPKVGIDGETIREFRLLVTALMDRVEDLARKRSTWWAEERVRARRVGLLRPYSLRFHRGEDGTIQLIFFNGEHAGRYPEFVRALTEDEDRAWSRDVECSECKRLRGSPTPARLTGLSAGS